jgi:membrane-associated protease RseP (regulator of RpoE activity)
MKHLSRPYQYLNRWGLITLAVAALCLVATPRTAHAQAEGVMGFFANPFPSLSHASQGYLGVEIDDVDQEKAQQLKLKDVRGAVITLIDHDAPAGKIGLKVNDVVISINGQNVEGAEQLKRMLHEIPAGRKISLEISRDGNIQTIAVELADRAAMERDVWNKMDKEDGDLTSPAPGMGILGPNGDVAAPPGFHVPFFSSSLKVGATVEPLTAQMAEALGVNGGLMVKQVERKSEAANAGLRALDVILKVGADPINTAADWERALRSNVGKQVQVTIQREKKQQTLSLQVDSKRHSELEFFDVFGDADPVLLAQNDLVTSQAIEAEADALRSQIEARVPALSQQQAEELRKQAEQMARQAEQFKIDPKQLQDLKQQMEQFKVDPKEMQQLQQQVEQWKKNFNADQFKIDPKQMEEMRKQMEEWKQQMQQQMEYLREQQSGHFV